MTQDHLGSRLSLTALAALTLLHAGCPQPCNDALDPACHGSEATDTDPTSSATTSSTSTSTSTSSSTSTSTSSGASETTAAAPFCGDGAQDPGEECDEGLANADDAACTASCRLNVCGDGLIHKGAEACDNGPANADNATCTSICTVNTCGDGFVHEGVEGCDEGPANADDAACTAGCVPNICGDGLLHQGVEECDFSPLDGCQGCKLLPLYVFVSSAQYQGALPPIDTYKGLELADAHCLTLAINAGHGGVFKAWLSSGGVGPADRFTLPPEPRRFVLMDNQPLANDWLDLTDGALLRPINIDETNKSVGPSLVWTNTKPDGTPASADHCEIWSTTATLTQGHVGTTEFLDAGWTDVTSTSCAASARLYCFQVSF